MKKLFTLVALLAMFMGAKAANWVEVYKIDFSQYKGFPHYVMGYVPEWVDGVMTDMGGNYRYVATVDGDGNPAEETSDYIVTTNNGVQYYRFTKENDTWHQYFTATGIPTQMDGHYKVVAMIKASESCTVPMQMRWSWGEDPVNAEASIPTEWTEVEWEYSGVAGTSCDLIAQPNTAAQIEWQWIKVYEDQKAQRPTTWQEWLTSDGQPVIVETTVDKIPTWMGNAETPWADATVRFDDQEKNYLICAWSKEKGRNMNEKDGWDPFPADIEVDETDPNNHVFVCHGQPATTEGDPSAWDNQFWIESPKSWKEGEQLKIHFRYRANRDGVKTNTQCHKQNPSDYQHWQAIGDITFNTEWQEFDKVVAWPSGAGDGVSWSIAFNLNPEVKDAVNFYFDDLSWQSMKLDEGLFVAAANTVTGIDYDFDNAIEFTYDAELEAYTATVGTEGQQDSWVNEIMISTVRGNDAAFKSNTIKPSGSFKGEDAWGEYTEASLAKVKVESGVWKIAVDTEGKQINFRQLEGEKPKEPIEINANPTVVVVKGLERDWLVADNNGNPQEAEIGTGQPWDNQFFIVANRELDAEEETVISFSYKASKAATSGTQCHGAPGAYIHYAAIGSFNFTEEWQEFAMNFTIPKECAGKGMKSIAFNLAEIKDACDYEFKDIIWKLKDDTESLIDQEGAKNFYVKEGAGTSPYEFGTDPSGINSVINDAKNASAVTYNIAGQRVSKDYKGLVIKEGKKYVVK